MPHMPKAPDEKWLAEVMQRVLAAYGSQGDRIGDSDLDNEQPLNLRVSLQLGDIRRARGYVQKHGMRPADFAIPRGDVTALCSKCGASFTPGVHLTKMCQHCRIYSIAENHN